MLDSTLDNVHKDQFSEILCYVHINESRNKGGISKIYFQINKKNAVTLVNKILKKFEDKISIDNCCNQV